MTEEQVKQKFKETYPDFMRGDEPLSPYFDIWEYGIEIATKELEEKISVLLSCKNCPENKGGLICQKEYENKCLAQKIQFIKELQEENAELKGIKDVATLIRANNDTVITLMQLNNMLVSKNQQLTKAKELLKWFVWYFREGSPNLVPYKHKVAEAEQFLKG